MSIDRTAPRLLAPRALATGVGLLLGLGALTACHLPRAAPSPAPAAGEVRLTLLHFSDYHAHAVPFFSEHQRDQGGIARALGYIKQVKATAPNVLVLSGGDMWNSGTPAWSDRYASDCSEWTWLGEHLTAMAFGNHDVDYGWDVFASCARRAGFPVLSGNLVDGADKLLLSDGGKPYVVRQLGGIKVGLFALSGPDFPSLVKPTNLPPGARFTDGIAAAQRIVRALRETEQVNVVVFFGHQSREADFAMARAVPGIDVILGSHSHYKGALQAIEGTSTYFISPFQYLNYLSQVELVLRGGRLVNVSGRLVRMDPTLAADPDVAARVARMQRDLEADPRYADRFQVIGAAAVELALDGIDRGESVLGSFAMDIARTAARAHLMLSTASSFRASIPPGPIRLEDYLTALPYKNRLLTVQLSGAQVQALLDLAAENYGSDGFGVTSGARYTIAGGRATDIALARPSDPTASPPQYEALEPARRYTVATTDYLANVAAGYKDLFAGAPRRDTGLVINDTILDFIKKNSPVSARLEGRITVQDPPSP
jgi:5'-nucleotidase